MTLATLDLRTMALRLIADETSSGDVSRFTPAARVCAKLGAVLSKLAGPAGSHSLLSRALALARTEAPGLAAVMVMPDGKLQGFEEMNSEKEQEELKIGGVILVVQLLGLLQTFIGQRLTLQLVDEAWPIVPSNRPAFPKTDP